MYVYDLRCLLLNEVLVAPCLFSNSKFGYTMSFTTFSGTVDNMGGIMKKNMIVIVLGNLSTEITRHDTVTSIVVDKHRCH